MKEDSDCLLHPVKISGCKDAIQEESYLAHSIEEDSNCQLESRLAQELALCLGLFDNAPQRHARLVRLA
jgi:hypothetical protein